MDFCSSHKQVDTVQGLTITTTLTKQLNSTTHHDMFDLLKIKLFGRQPVAKISDQLLDALIERDYESNAGIVKTKLQNINSDSQAGKNRIAAGIIKLANKNFDNLDGLIGKANEDSRDIMMWAEYPRCTSWF